MITKLQQRNKGLDANSQTMITKLQLRNKGLDANTTKIPLVSIESKYLDYDHWLHLTLPRLSKVSLISLEQNNFVHPFCHAPMPYALQVSPKDQPSLPVSVTSFMSTP